MGKRILITGANGQLGFTLSEVLRNQGFAVCATTHETMDITDEASIEQIFNQFHPDMVIHCAAYTAVDLAETYPEKCNRVNIQGTQNIVNACESSECKLAYISTDYVFNGSGEKPWREEDTTDALSVYGKSKMEAERLVLASALDAFIVRTAWTYSSYGKNFVKTILSLAEEKETIRVVNDQIGSPTYINDLADKIVELIQTERYGIYHITNTGYCSWYEFACEIIKRAGKQVTILPITSEEYHAKAIRPKNSRLSCEKLEKNGLRAMPHWRDALQRYFDKLAQ